MHPSKTYLVDTRPYESIIPKVTADVRSDDFSIDAILGNKVLVRTGRGCCSTPIAFSVSSRHGWKSDENVGLRRKKASPEKKKKMDASHANHVSLMEQCGSTEIGNVG